MKKIIAVCAILFSVSAGQCATQYNAIGAVQMSSSTASGSTGLWNATLAQIASLTAPTTGAILWCTNCVSVNNGLGTVCASTGSTVSGQYIISGSSLAAVTVCK